MAQTKNNGNLSIKSNSSRSHEPELGLDFREELELGFSVIDESGVDKMIVGNFEQDCLGGKFHHEIE